MDNYRPEVQPANDMDNLTTLTLTYLYLKTERVRISANSYRQASFILSNFLGSVHDEVAMNTQLCVPPLSTNVTRTNYPGNVSEYNEPDITFLYTTPPTLSGQRR